MKHSAINWAGIVALVLCGIAVTGCNTVSGFGQDMRDAGSAVKKAAE
jgi:predicted small secreted protein